MKKVDYALERNLVLNNQLPSVKNDKPDNEVSKTRNMNVTFNQSNIVQS